MTREILSPFNCKHRPDLTPSRLPIPSPAPVLEQNRMNSRMPLFLQPAPPSRVAWLPRQALLARGPIHPPQASLSLIPGDSEAPPKSPRRGTRLPEPHRSRAKLFRCSRTRGAVTLALSGPGRIKFVSGPSAERGGPELRRTPQPVCTHGGVWLPAEQAEVGVSGPSQAPHKPPNDREPNGSVEWAERARSCPARLAPAAAHQHRSASSRSSAGG